MAGTTGSTDGTGGAARFNGALGVATDSAGNVYVADTFNETIRKITPAGVVTTLAGTAGMSGSTDGTGAAARFKAPWGLAADGVGNVYVADTGNDTIRKITPAGMVTTLAGMVGMTGSVDGMGTAARFNSPFSVASDSSGNVYVADGDNDSIRKITPDGMVSTLAGTAGITGSADGTGAAARFSGPQGVTTDSAGNVYVADNENHTIRRITPAGVVSTFAGTAPIRGSTDGTGAAASFDGPQSATTDSAGNTYVADTGNSTIRKITPAGVVTTFAGMAGMTGSADGPGAAARFNSPTGVATDNAGNVYVADLGNGTIRKITPGGVATTLAGMAGVTGSSDGTGAAARFDGPKSVATDSASNVYVADQFNSIIRKVTPSGVVTTLAGTAGVLGSSDGTGAAASFRLPIGVATDGAGNVYLGDNGNGTIRKITPAGVVTTLAGMPGVTGSADGTGAGARFYSPQGVATDSAGNVYVADTGNSTIRKITPAGVVTTVVGRPGQSGFLPGPLPGLLDTPQSVALLGTTLYTTTNNAIVQVSNLP
jgi:hypothetical protein